MTFFLRDGKPSRFEARGPDVGIPDFSEVVGAGFRLAQLEYDANFRARREDAKEWRGVLDQIMPLLTDEDVQAYLSDKGIDAPPSREIALQYASSDDSGAMRRLAEERAAADPEKWKGVDLSEDNMRARVDARLQAEHQAQVDVMSMAGPGARLAGGLIGGAAGLTVDVRNVPFLFMGGGSTLLRRVGASAAANVAAEAAFLPSAFEMAERLQIPDPDIAQTLAMAAVGGAAFQGVIEGGVIAGRALGRGLEYARARDATRHSLPGYDEQWSRIAQDAAEDAMSSRGTDPIEVMMDALRDAPPPRPETTGEPLIPDVEPPSTRIPEPTTDAPTDPLSQLPETAARIETAVLSPMEGEAPRTDGELAAMARDAINDADDPGVVEARAGAEYLASEANKIIKDTFKGRRYPLLTAMSHKIRIKRDSDTARELADTIDKQPGARAVAGRMMVDRFKDGEDAALDNMVAADWEQSFPGISHAAGVQGDYLDPNGVRELIRQELHGDWSWHRDVIEADRLRGMADEINADLAAGRFDAYVRRETESIVTDFRAGQPVESGFYVPRRDFWSPEDTEQLGVMFDKWAEQKKYDLFDREREEILWQLRKDGGDAEYLVERAFERGLSEPEYATLFYRKADESATQFDSEPPPEASGTGREVAGEPELAGAPSRGGDESAERLRDFATERTGAGEQFVIPGAERVDPAAGLRQSQQAEVQARAQQSMIRRGDQSRVEADDQSLFGAGAQKDIFDEPTGPKARAAQDDILDGMTDDLFLGFDDPDTGAWVGPVDFDGRPIRSADAARKYIADMDEFSAVLDLCGRKS